MVPLSYCLLVNPKEHTVSTLVTETKGKEVKPEEDQDTDTPPPFLSSSSFSYFTLFCLCKEFVDSVSGPKVRGSFRGMGKKRVNMLKDCVTFFMSDF